MDHLKRSLLKHSLLFSAMAALPGGLSAAPEQQFITDIRGRQIDCRLTPQRIYVADASLMFLYVSLTGKRLTEKLAAIPAAFRHADELSYQQYSRAFPSLAALPHFAPLAGAQANTETIIELHPDIIFVTTGTFSAMETGGIPALLERAGIQIVVLDMSISPLKNTPRSIAVMGAVLGVPDSAAEMIAFIHSHLALVTSRLAAAPYRPVPVLLERAAGFSAECCYAYGNGNFAEFLTCAGGKNIGADYIDGTYGTLNQETIIHTRPEKVIVTGGQWQSYNPGGDWVGLGPGADLTVAEKQLAVLLMAGEIQLIRDNDISALPVDAPLLWQAVDMQSGQYCAPGMPGTAKYDSPSACLTGNGGTPLLSENMTHYNSDPADNSYPPGLLDGPFFSIKTANNLPVPHLLQLNGLAPYGEKPQTDQIYLRNYGERALMRGGAWYSQEFAGVSAFCLSHTVLHRSATVGGRTAWIAP